MTNKNGMRLTLLTAIALLLLLCIPDAAYARGGGMGGGGGGRASSGTSRVGPAGSGSVGRTRTRASGRGDLIRDTEDGGDQRHSSADSRRERAAAGNRAAARPLPAARPIWRRPVNGRRYTVAEWNDADMDCGKVERVDGVSYFYCDGAWWEKVFEGGAVTWVEVQKP